jgi:hypothetical protein
MAEGYSIPNTGKNAKVGYRTLKNDVYEGNNSAMSKVINALDFSPLGESPGAYL